MPCLLAVSFTPRLQDILAEDVGPSGFGGDDQDVGGMVDDYGAGPAPEDEDEGDMEGLGCVAALLMCKASTSPVHEWSEAGPSVKAAGSGWGPARAHRAKAGHGCETDPMDDDSSSTGADSDGPWSQVRGGPVTLPNIGVGTGAGSYTYVRQGGRSSRQQ